MDGAIEYNAKLNKSEKNKYHMIHSYMEFKKQNKGKKETNQETDS